MLFDKPKKLSKKDAAKRRKRLDKQLKFNKPINWPIKNTNVDLNDLSEILNSAENLENYATMRT